MSTMEDKQAVKAFLRDAGYADRAIDKGFAYADSIRWSNKDELGQLALSRILYGDDQLNAGARVGWESAAV